jgi:hypothetical protein
MIGKQLISAMGEPLQATSSTKFDQRGQIERGVEPVSNDRDNVTARIGGVVPTLKESEETDNYQDVEQPSRQTNPRKPRGAVRMPEDIICDSEVRHRNRFQAQRFQFRQLKHDYASLKVETDGLKKELESSAKANMNQMFYVDRYNYIVEHTLLPYAQDRRLHFDNRTADTLNFVLRPLLEDAREAETLRHQVETLQKELLAREKTTTAISDEHFGNQFRKLAAQIKTLSRLLHPYEDLDVVQALGPCIMASGGTSNNWNGRVGRKLFIEAWTWSVLMQMVFQSPFTIFGEEGRIVANLWSSLFGTRHCHEWPNPSSPCENWRLRTMEKLVASVDENIITRGAAKEGYLYHEQHVVDARACAIDAIMTGLARITPTADSSQVLQIVDGAFTLSMHMSLQQPRLQIKFPKSGEKFHKTEMKLLATLDEEDSTDHGTIAAIVNPGLMKWGDVQGRKLDHCFCIVPALVQVQGP